MAVCNNFIFIESNYRSFILIGASMESIFTISILLSIAYRLRNLLKSEWSCIIFHWEYFAEVETKINLTQRKLIHLLSPLKALEQTSSGSVSSEGHPQDADGTLKVFKWKWMWEDISFKVKFNWRDWTSRMIFMRVWSFYSNNSNESHIF